MSRPDLEQLLGEVLSRELGDDRAAQLLGMALPNLEQPPGDMDVLFLRLLASELEQKGRLSEPGRTASNLWNLAARLEHYMGPK